MLQQNANLFDDQEILEELVGPNLLILKDPDNVWLVDSGTVDVFAIELESNRIVGSREHMFRSKPGDVLFGMELTDENDFGFMVIVRAGDRLLKLNRSQLVEKAQTSDKKNLVVTLIDQWVQTLTLGLSNQAAKNLISRTNSPASYFSLKSGEEIILNEGENAYPDQGTLWVQHLQGSCHLMGREELVLDAEDGFLPVNNLAWLKCANQSQIQIMETSTIIDQEAFWIGLEGFHQKIKLCLDSIHKQKELTERKRLEIKDNQDHQVAEHSMNELASILNTNVSADEFQTDDVLAADTDSEDPLLSACQAIGDILDISMQSHPDTRGSHKQTPLDIAEASRVRVRKVILTPNWWGRDNGPILSYFLDEETTDDRQPIALLPTSDHSYDLYDPVKRTRTPVTPEIANTVNPVGYTFFRSFPAKVITVLDLVKFGIRGLGNEVRTILLMGFLGGLLGLLTPMVMGMIYDDIIPNTQRSQLVYIALALFAGAFGSVLFQLTQSLATLRVSSKIESVLQAAQWDRLMTLPASFFRQFTVGDLAQRAMGISQIRTILSGTAVSSVVSSIFSVFNFGLMFYYNWKLSLVATGLSVIYAATLMLLGYLQVRRQAELVELEGKITGSLLGFINGIPKLRVAGAEVSAFGIWAKMFSAQRQIGFKIGTIDNVLAVITSTFSPLASVIIFWYLTKQILDSQQLGIIAGGILSTGQFLAFTSAYGSFQTSLASTSFSILQVLAIFPQWRRAKPILETKPEHSSEDKDPGELSGEIEIAHASFRYTSDGPLILDDVSLHIEPGEFVAFVGPSGSGKSTCLRLLLGFESPESGSVFYDQQDLSSLAINRIRRQIGVVLQQSNLVTGDLFRNIVGSSPELTMDDAWDAARMAGLDKDIEQMPMGMHTVVSEGATTFSGGQRQRLLIARALVRKPRILFFDEATSALDNNAQATVTQSLETLSVTRIAVAHRLSTIQGADKIYVFDKGKIVQQGTYDELISQEGTFAELAKRQIA